MFLEAGADDVLLEYRAAAAWIQAKRLNQIKYKTRSAGFTPALRVCFLLFLMLRPIKRPSNRLIPAGEQLAALILVHRGRVQRIAPRRAASDPRAVPHTGRESGEIACAERGRSRMTGRRIVQSEISLWNCIRKLSRLAPPSTEREERETPVSRFMAVSRSFT